MNPTDRDTLDSVEKLLAERRKIAGWMSALDARRAETSAAVYQRVHEDYLVKMEKVQTKLLAASDSVNEAAGDVAGRLVDKEAVLATKQDERSEAELRAAVGEYSEREWEKRRTRLDDEILAATGERDALRDELARLRRVLGEVAGAASAGEVPAGEAPPVEAEPLQEMDPRPLEAAAPAKKASSRARTPAAAVETIQPEPSVIPIHEQSGIAPVEPAATLEPTFDELAFLKTVVGRPTPLASSQVVPEPAPSPAPLPRSTMPSFPVPEPPLEYPDALPEPRVSQEMTPPRESFFGRPTPRSSEAIKSLKCQECGTLNFPTEWYCERCGGELAAM